MRLSGVKVPRPASPFITHETPIVNRRDGGCCISWQSERVDKIELYLNNY